MAELILSNRLKSIALFSGKCKVFADVGCDHALLSIYMVNEGLAENSILSDINKGPLDTARANTNAFAKNKEKFDFRLGDGLKVYKPFEADTTAICGMGGLLIASMLESSPEISKNTTLVLEPNTCVSDLRKYLFDNGYEILDEVGLCEKEHPYIIMKVRYTGNCIQYDDLSLYLGNFVCNRLNEDDKTYIKQLRTQFERILDGISKSEKKSPENFLKSLLYNNLINKINVSLGDKT